MNKYVLTVFDSDDNRSVPAYMLRSVYGSSTFISGNLLKLIEKVYRYLSWRDCSLLINELIREKSGGDVDGYMYIEGNEFMLYIAKEV